MDKNFKFKKADIVPGTFLKTKLCDELLVVKDIDEFKPWEIPFYSKKLLDNPVKAFAPRMEVLRYLLGPNRCFALAPNGEKFFPKLNQIYYIINLTTNQTNE